MTTDPADNRARPNPTDGERKQLEGWLDYHRETLALKCAGLDDAQLRARSAPPSPITLLGLVRHMAEVERGWFVSVFGGEPAAPLYCTEDRPDRDFECEPGDTTEEAFATWREQIALARSTAAGRDLAETSPDPLTGERYSLRWVHLHMIEEYARHNGHADLVRERIDGATGM
ncbi:DinB family protein [Streptomyces xiaopingdaonensis]|uniref:DinB family protein n=1 Tax=Streptomyces xiaopingdaonensis TaxID=1565415 RepID=UPI00030A114B|nr:DinB family protein [Streptomyces xiaopingdaonensis]